jgi:hypothetical protein
MEEQAEQFDEGHLAEDDHQVDVSPTMTCRKQLTQVIYHKQNDQAAVRIKFIQDKSRRLVTFSKRKAGIIKKVSAVVRLTPVRLSRLFRLPNALSRLPIGL